MVNASGKYFSITEILEKYPNIFLDTNIFLQINLDLDKSNKKELLKSFKIKEGLLDFWIPVLKENPGIYTTKNILEELKRDHFNYKKEFKKKHSPQREYVEILRIKKRLKNKRNLLLDDFPPERILNGGNLEEKAIYEELYNKYNYFVEFCKEIGEEDFGLLLWGGIFSKLKENTCLISNDSGILRCYKSFLYKERISKNNFGFYIQNGLNFFKRV